MVLENQTRSVANLNEAMGWRRRPPNSTCTALILIALLAHSCTAQSSGIPRITFVSPSLRISENSSLTLECQADGTPPMQVLVRVPVRKRIQYQWHRDDRPLTQLSLDGTYSQLHVRRAQSGLYRCLARNAAGAVFSAGVDVRVAYADEFNARDTSTQYRFEALRNAYVIMTPPPIEHAPAGSLTWRWFYGDAVVRPRLVHAHERAAGVVERVALHLDARRARHPQRAHDAVGRLPRAGGAQQSPGSRTARQSGVLSQCHS